MEAKVIKLENVAPNMGVVAIPIPEGGGIVLFKAPNGGGKTKALEAIDALATGTGSPTLTEGADRGEVSAFGATLRFGRRKSRSGELEVTSLEGFSIADLVDPKIKDPLAADAHRIKALIRLTGAKATPDMFHSIFPSPDIFNAVVSAEALSTDDPVTMAASIKRDVEKAARGREAESNTKMQQSDASRLAVGEIDTTQEDDEKVLAAEYERASNEKERLRTQAESFTTAFAAHQEATQLLENAQQNYTGLSVEAARAEYVEINAGHRADEDEYTRLKYLLDEAEKKTLESRAAKMAAGIALENAKTHEQTIADWRKTVDSSMPKPVSQIMLERASNELEEAREASNKGVLIRQAKQHLAKAEALKEEALEIERQADLLRDAAKSTELVLSGIVSMLGVPLTVQGGRLIAQAPDRLAGQEPFDELSSGEQWKLVGEIAVNAVGPKGIIVMPQVAWAELDDNNKQILAGVVEGTGVVLLSAVADSSKEILGAEIYEPFPLG